MWAPGHSLVMPVLDVLLKKHTSPVSHCGTDLFFSLQRLGTHSSLLSPEYFLVFFKTKGKTKDFVEKPSHSFQALSGLPSYYLPRTLLSLHLSSVEAAARASSQGPLEPGSSDEASPPG